MELRCPAVEGGQLPVRFTRDGPNVSPPLRWSGVPDGAVELVLLFEQITPSTREPHAHWIVYGLAPDLRELPEGFRHAAAPSEPVPARQGRNDEGNTGYDGPLGTAGREVKLRFTLFALDRPSELAPGADRGAVLRAIADREADRAELVVSFERPRPVTS